MINMFYHNDEWMISTRSNIGCKNYWKEKTSFKDLFNEVSDNLIESNDLHRDHCYSFVLQHTKNKIVGPIHSNCLVLVQEYDLTNHTFIDDMTKISSDTIYHVSELNQESVDHYLNNKDLDYKIKGFTVTYNDKRYSWINPNYDYVLNLKLNNNHTLLDYIELRQTKKLKDYLHYFPENLHLFNEYKQLLYVIKQKLYNYYVSLFIRKEIDLQDIEYPYKPLVYKLHEYYQTMGQKITLQIVNDYVFQLPGKKIMFIQNYSK